MILDEDGPPNALVASKEHPQADHFRPAGIRIADAFAWVKQFLTNTQALLTFGSRKRTRSMGREARGAR